MNGYDYRCDGRCGGRCRSCSMKCIPALPSSSVRPSERPCDKCERPTERTEPPREPPPKKDLLLDVIGCHRELTVIGHISVIKCLPFIKQHNLLLLEEYYRSPGNYSGRPGSSADLTAEVIDYGRDYLALKLYDDLSRPDVGEFLLNKGWEMIGFATYMCEESVFTMEKWCSKAKDCDKC